jgi:hypothetical protein
MASNVVLSPVLAVLARDVVNAEILARALRGAAILIGTAGEPRLRELPRRSPCEKQYRESQGIARI